LRPVKPCVAHGSANHEAARRVDVILRFRIEYVIKRSFRAMLDAKTKYHINPTGRFVIGGPMGDAG